MRVFSSRLIRSLIFVSSQLPLLGVNASPVLGGPGRSHCIQITWQTDERGGRRAMQEDAPIKFMELNGVGLYFSPVPGSARYNASSTLILSSLSETCFDRDLIEVGTNTFKYDYSWAGAGSASSVVRLFGVGGVERDLFRSFYQYGVISHHDQTTIQFSLEEIDPEAAGHIEALKNEIANLNRKIEAVRRDGDRVLNDLETRVSDRVKALLALDFEALSADQLADIEGDLPGIQQFVRDLKSNYESLKASVNGEIRVQHALLDSLEQSFASSVDGTPFPANEDTLARLGVMSIEVPDVPPADMVAEEIPLNPSDNVYAQQADQVIACLSQAAESDKRSEFILLTQAWIENQKIVEPAILQHAGVSNRERAAFRDNRQRVLDFIHRYIDDYGFFKDSPVPTSARQSVDRDIKLHQSKKAEELKDALNTWKDELSPDRKLVVEAIEGLGAAYRASDNLSSVGERAQTRNKLDHVLDGAITAAKIVGRMALAATPLNDFVDFCELITGREACLPNGAQLSWLDRSFSGIGLIAGNGQFWRLMANDAHVETKVARESAALVEEAAAVETAFDASSFAKKLKTFSKANAPAKELRQVTIYRRLPKTLVEQAEHEGRIANLWAITEKNISASHRYTRPGEGGLYVATRSEIAEAEVRYYDNLSRLKGYPSEETKEISMVVDLDGLLDLRDPDTVRRLMGVEFSSLVKPGDHKLTQWIGMRAKELGYKGVIFKSAQVPLTEVGENIVIFMKPGEVLK